MFTRKTISFFKVFCWSAQVCCANKDLCNVSITCTIDGKWAWENLSLQNCSLTGISQILAIINGNGTINFTDLTHNLRFLIKHTRNITFSDIRRVSDILKFLKKVLMTIEITIFEDLVETIHGIIKADQAWKESQEQLILEIFQSSDDILKKMLMTADLQSNYNLKLQRINTIVINDLWEEEEFVYDSDSTLRVTGDGQGNEQFKCAIMVFQDVQSSFPNGSKKYNVISVSVLPSLGLKKTIEITYSMKMTDDSKPKCQVLIDQGNGLVWTDSGCLTTKEGNKKIRCTCHHLSVFSILMNPNTAYTDETSLRLITQVGLGASIFFLIVSILIFGLLKSKLKMDKVVPHLALCSNLTVSSIIFLFGIEATDNKLMCKAVAAFLQYFLVAGQMSMMAEGITIINLTYCAFRQLHIWKFLLLIIYGAPLLVVVITLSVTGGEGFGTPDHCWLSQDIVWVFIGTVIFVAVVNLVILICIIMLVVQLEKVLRKQTFDRIKAGIWAFVVLCPLLGTTYLTGLLTLKGHTIVTEYVFATFNASQGFMVFLINVVASEEIRNGLKKRYQLYKSRQLVSPKRSHTHAQKDLTVEINKKCAQSTPIDTCYVEDTRL